MSEDGATLSCSGLSKSYEATGGPVVLRGVGLELFPGDTLAVTGASGCGKSTLLHVVGGLAEADSGTVRICGEDMGGAGQARRGALRNEHVGFVYQFHHLLSEFTAAENVAMPLMVAGRGRAEAMEVAGGLLGEVGLGACAGRQPGSLSGGERQRVAVARAFANSPDCVIADEPTGNLDRKSADEVAELLLGQCESRGCALVVATHDMDLAARMSRRRDLVDGSLRQA